ncbi:MAG: hypothetical protein AAGM67_20040, partial [Bacteroidota bacterium]
SYLHLGELEKAKQQIDRASQIDGNDMHYTFRNLALYHEAKGDDQSAEKYFRKALAMNRDMGWVHHYGEFLWRLGRKELAKRCFEISALHEEPEGKNALQKYFPVEAK